MNQQYSPTVVDRLRFGADADRHNRELGIYVAWLARLGLLSETLTRRAADSVTALHLQSMTGSDFLSLELHGELTEDHLNSVGRAFTEHYYASGAYAGDLALLQTGAGESEWDRYATVAAIITAAYERFRSAAAEPARPVREALRATARILKFPRR